MHGPNEIHTALLLASRGRSATEISRLTGIPRRTICDWLNDRAPRRGRGAAETCLACGQGTHRLHALPEEYVYLLGAYLGDGCISSHPRGVFRLRIVLDAKYPRIIDEVAAAINAVRPENHAAGASATATTAPG